MTYRHLGLRVTVRDIFSFHVSFFSLLPFGPQPSPLFILPFLVSVYDDSKKDLVLALSQLSIYISNRNQNHFAS